jgi:hypothetical protein
MYDKITLLKLKNLFNEVVKNNGDYPIEIKDSKMKYYTYKIVMLTEDGEKHKYLGTCKECCEFLLEYLAEVGDGCLKAEF